METQDQIFTRGYNSGYQMRQHEPELLDTLLKSPDKDHDYIQGLKEGKKQRDREKVLEQLKQSPRRTKGKERER